MTDLLDDIAYVARRRTEGALEKDIAAELGLTPAHLAQRVRRWRKKHPGVDLPCRARRPKVPFYLQAAKMRREEGLSAKQIAERMGKALTTVHVYLTKARAEGHLPKTTSRDVGGYTTWRHYAVKGAATPLGNLARVLDGLSPEEVERLLRSLGRDDKTLADLLRRIVKEYLDAQQAPE